MTWAAVSRNYTAEDMALAEAVADRLAAALENARLYAVAQQAIHARDEFLILAAHELRTPLTALELFVHAAQSGARSPDAPDEGGRRVVRQVRRLSTLVERLCDAASIRAEGIALTPGSRATWPAIVRERVDAARERSRPGGQSFEVRTPRPFAAGGIARAWRSSSTSSFRTPSSSARASPSRSRSTARGRAPC